MVGEVVGDSVGDTDGVIVGCSDGVSLGPSGGKWFGERERSLFRAIVPWQVPQVTLQGVCIVDRRYVSSE